MNKFTDILRVPDGQKSVKDRLLAAICQRPPRRRDVRQADRAGDSGRRAEEASRIAVAARFPVAHGEILGNALLALEPGDRLLLVADFVDELQPERLAAGEDPPVRSRSRGPRPVIPPPRRYEALEPVEARRDQRAQSCLRFRRSPLERARRSLQRRGFQRLHVDAQLFEEAHDVRELEQHADGADPRGLCAAQWAVPMAAM